MPQFQIRNRYTNDVIFEGDFGSMRECVEKAVKSGSNLSGSNLSGSNLSGSNLSGSDLGYSNLRGSDLSGSDLSGSDLSYSNLSGSDLSGSNLSGSDLSGSDLSYSNLSGSDLRGSNLRGSDLSGSNLRYSNLRGSDLSGSDLSYSNLSGSDLRGSNLSEAKDAELIIARQRITPDGEIVGWKKLNGGVICMLTIPNDARRLNSIGSRKCRAEYAVCVALFKNGAMFDGEATDKHSGTISYKAGAVIKPDAFDDNIQAECSNGIHFFLTREEAEAY